MSYVDGFVAAVPAANKEAYRAHAAKVAPLFRQHGATRVMECWGDDVPHGKQTDFYRAVAAGENEAVVFAWIEWPSKDARDAGWQKLMQDPAMQPGASQPPFDGKRMIYGGFAALDLGGVGL